MKALARPTRAGCLPMFWATLTTIAGLALIPAPTRAAVTAKTTFTHAYELPGGSTGNEAGLLLVSVGTPTMRSFQESASGDWSKQDIALEIWFKPDNLTPTPSNGQILSRDEVAANFDAFEITDTAGNGQPDRLRRSRRR